MKSKNNVAIILARGGSKTIPKKNIKNFCGKPLIAWSIEQAKNTKNIKNVWVSSDDKKILSISKKFGAKTILRPKSLSKNTSTSVSGWIHAINEIEKMDDKIDTVIALQPTSPIREVSDLENSIQKFTRNNFDSMFSASKIGDFYIWRKKGKSYSSINYDFHNRPRRQDFEEQYVENGSFYIFKPNTIRKFQNQLGGKIGISLMDFWKSFEIDDSEDLKFLKILMNNYLLKDTKRG
jgi:N-acylneuraminate cytidylyltransferase|tara:strand:+ start:391 stop:1098 length:708 start_codon:yes stop_codon:yes gene_type:complete